MRRVHPDGSVTDLPSLAVDQLDEDESLFLQAMLGFIETGDMFHGRFIEVHVGRLLGADLPTTGINGWDLLVPGPPPIPVEVKSTSFGGSYNIAKKTTAHAWVFVAYADKAERPRAFSYVVAPGHEIAAIGQSDIAQSKVFKKFEPALTAAELPEAVRAAAAVHRNVSGPRDTTRTGQRRSPHR